MRCPAPLEPKILLVSIGGQLVLRHALCCDGCGLNVIADYRADSAEIAGGADDHSELTRLKKRYNLTGDEEIKPVLKRAVDLIIGCQSKQGGWRYNPDPSGADISVTIMQVMALRAAKTAGMHVPDTTLKKAIGLAYLPLDKSGQGNEFTVLVRGKEARARVVPTPFYKRAK